MLEIILALFSSSGVGSIVGLIGGLANRWADYKFKEQDREHELRTMDKDLEFMKTEYEQRVKVTSIEADAAVETAGYEAMAESYNYARPTNEDGIIDSISKVIRPLLTLCFFFFSVYIFYTINSMIQAVGLEPSIDQVFVMWKSSIEWILFQAGVAIGWWFAMRPGRAPNFGGK